MTGRFRHGQRVLVHTQRYTPQGDVVDDEWKPGTIRSERWNGGLGGFWTVSLDDGEEVTYIATRIKETP